MAEILNYFDAGLPRDVFERVLSELAVGRLVGLPFDTCYAVCGVATDEQLGKAMPSFDTGESMWALACANPESAIAYLGSASPLQSRLASRLWPGPVLMRFPEAAEGDALRSISPEVLSLVRPGGGLQVVVPESPLCRHVLELLPGPLVWAASGTRYVGASAEQLSQRAGSKVRLIVDAGPTLRRYPLTILDVSRGEWNVARPGAVPERAIAEAGCCQVLFVCSGNTCRSPMAERLFRKMLSGRLRCSEEDLIRRGFSVRSAGLAAFEGAPASVESVELLRESGIDLSDHQSRRVDANLLLHADHVLTMTRMHRETILQQYPQLEDRVRTVAPDGMDVSDPYGGGIEEYRRCCNQLDGYLAKFADSLVDGEPGEQTS